jgi:hypothetical protein
MEADLQNYVAFYLTGNKQPGRVDAGRLDGLEDIAGLNLRPALFAAYRDLSRLRYDFPLVLIDDPQAKNCIEPLSGLIDAILAKVAHGPDGERIRQHVLRLEQDIRARAGLAGNRLFSELWDKSAAALIKKAKQNKQDKSLADSLSLARANLITDGEVIDCNAELSFRLFGHAWGMTQMRRARKFNADISRLQLKLNDILQADFIHSDAGKSPESLKQAFGSGPLDRFDFAAMSRLLKKATPREKLSASRRQRVTELIATLRTQKFFPSATPQAGAKGASAPYSFAFDTCSAALKAYRERLPKAVELARAMAIAELEIRGEYSAAKHDAIFASFGKNGLVGDELALFPDSLVRIKASALAGTEQNVLNEILAAEQPIKVLVQTDDILESPLIDNGHCAFAQRSTQLARMAIGLDAAFVLQSPAANLYPLRQSIQRGLDFNGPALFSIYSGAASPSAALPPYLLGAAALESRAFPAFCFDPSAGDGWATRFSLDGNPQPTADWPLHTLSYQDERLQRVEESTPFTLVDFVACDARYARHFARIPNIPRAQGAQSQSQLQVPLASILPRNSRGQLDSVPYLMLADDANVLQRVLVAETLVREARRCKAQWNSLQELAGIHNSHVEKALAAEREANKLSDLQISAAPAPAVTAPLALAATAEPVASEAEKSSAEAYIETPRCASCNECIQINDKLFAYDGNKQAFIADARAGTYAQLVEAAENCQVAIIHPGQPLNPNEAGLDELLKRAEAFM